MADIAFLLLTFFLVTTTIANDRGLILQLPAQRTKFPNDYFKVQERNLFKIQVNSSDALLVGGEPLGNVSGLKDQVKRFILNYGVDKYSSDDPMAAIVSFKTDRGTSHKKFVEILDILQGAYYDIYADRAGVSNARWRELVSDLNNPQNRSLYEKGRGRRPDGSVEIPMQVSIAEPTEVGNQKY